MTAIGGLRARLVLEEPVRMPDGGGGASESWVEMATVWGRIKARSGGEAVDADRVTGTVTQIITIRYRAGVVPQMRFRSGSRIFHILSVVNVEDRDRWLVCRCEERDL